MANPVLENVMNRQNDYISSMPMTVSGTLNKLFVMFLILCVSFGAMFYQYSLGYVDKVMQYGIIAAVVGTVVAMIIIFARKAWNLLVPVYAFCEGAFLGSISAVYNAQFDGLVSQAIILTFLTMFSLFFLYKTRVIRVTEQFRSTIMIATFGVGLFYLVAIILSFLGISLPVFYSSGPLSILFSVVICCIAALNLLLDFDFIENGAINGLDRQYEWYGAFGLLVTLIWLYVEILKLLAKLRDR